jgi:hypothetical protein
MSRKTTPTYVLLNQITLAAASSSVTFSNIPQGYGDLILVCEVTGTNIDIKIKLNSDNTAANYPSVVMRGLGSGSGQSFTSSQGIGYVSSGARGYIQSQIMDYSATDKHKTILNRDSDSSLQVVARAMRWTNTAAVNSVAVTGDSAFAIGSTFSLYGVHA